MLSLFLSVLQICKSVNLSWPAKPSLRLWAQASLDRVTGLKSISQATWRAGAANWLEKFHSEQDTSTPVVPETPPVHAPTPWCWNVPGWAEAGTRWPLQTLHWIVLAVSRVTGCFELILLTLKKDTTAHYGQWCKCGDSVLPQMNNGEKELTHEFEKEYV